MQKIQLGDIVTTTRRKEAYYSNYGGNVECFFEPGDTGVVGAVKVPKVYKTPGGDYFCCVDFTKHGKEWRVGIGYDIVRKVRQCKQ